MEPIDYEEFLSANRNEIEKDALRHLLIFPPDDVEIVELNKKFSTIDPLKPELEYKNEQNFIIFLKKFNFDS